MNEIEQLQEAIEALELFDHAASSARDMGMLPIAWQAQIEGWRR